MEKGKEILTVGQEQQKVTTLHYSITEKELSRIAEVILSELKDDAQIKEIYADFQAYVENLVGVDVLDGINIVEEYEIAIRDCLDDLAEETPSEEVLYDVVFFVDSKDRICGMELSEEGKILSRSEILYKDSKFVGEVETDLDGDTMRISLNGEYTKTDSKCSYTVAVNEVTYAQVIMDMVMETEDTRHVLSLDVIPTDELLSVMFEDSGATGTMVAMLEPSIRFTAYGEGEEQISIIELLSNEEKFASVTFSTGPSGGEGVTLPTSDQAMEMDQIVDWCNSISVEKVEELINTLKLPAELDESISPFVDYARSLGGFGNLISMFMG